MDRTIIPYLIVLIIIMWATSCNQADPVCPDTQAFDFKLTISKITDSTSTSIKIYHPDLDTLNNDNDFPVLISVPVDVNADSTTFFIDFINDTTKTRETDTIAFTYTKKTYLKHQECGFIMEFAIDSVYMTFNHIDSAFWVNSLINKDNERNLEIYY